MAFPRSGFEGSGIMLRRPGTVAAILSFVILGIFVWYRASGIGTPPVVIDPDNPALVSQGMVVYAEHCSSCHGANLEGEANWQEPLPDGGLRAPPHDATGHTWHHPDDMLFHYTRDGAAAFAPADFVSNMPAFGDRLDDDEIRAALAFIISRWPQEIRDRRALRANQN